MEGHIIFDKPDMGYTATVSKDGVVVTCRGKELYQLVSKATGHVCLAAFESKFAANRFFAENTGYFPSKIN